MDIEERLKALEVKAEKTEDKIAVLLGDIVAQLED